MDSMLDYDSRYSKTPHMQDTTTDPRQRLVQAAAEMLRRRGLNATSVREVAKLAQAPLGSTYHYFPAGKPQLVSEAVSLSAGQIAGYLQKQLANGPRAGLAAFFALWRQLLADSDYAAGCPVMAVVADEDAARDEALPLAAALQAIARWQQLLAEALAAAGLPPARAANLARLMIAAVEGAILLCRAERSSAPLDAVASELDAWLASLLPD